MINFSIVIPCYNENENINVLIENITKLNFQKEYEIIIVDDCSEVPIDKNIFYNISNLKIIRHKKNAGQSASLYSGVLSATNNVIVSMDGDNQNDPKDIIIFIEKFNKNNYDLIQGIRNNRKDSINKKIASKFANSIRSFILNDKCKDSACGFRLFKRNKFLKLVYFDHMHRFLPYLFQKYNFSVDFINVNHQKRLFGSSKYNNILRLVSGIIDMFGVIWITRRRYKGSINEEEN